MLEPVDINHFNEAKEFTAKCENKKCIMYNKEIKFFSFFEGKKRRPRFIDINNIRELKCFICQKCKKPFLDK